MAITGEVGIDISKLESESKSQPNIELPSQDLEDQVAYENTFVQQVHTMSGLLYSTAGANDFYDSELTIDSRIVRADSDFVVLECLIDPVSGALKEYQFDRRLVDGIVPIEYHQYVVVHTRRKVGKLVYTFSDGSKRKSAVAALFDRRDPFAGLDPAAFMDDLD